MNADDLTNLPTSALVERTVTSARNEPILQRSPTVEGRRE
jgi:hypothetical protein